MKPKPGSREGYAESDAPNPHEDWYPPLGTARLPAASASSEVELAELTHAELLAKENTELRTQLAAAQEELQRVEAAARPFTEGLKWRGKGVDAQEAIGEIEWEHIAELSAALSDPTDGGTDG